MKRIARQFWSESEGSVALDWMVLMAGIASLGFAVAATLAAPGGAETAGMAAPAALPAPPGGA